MNISGSDDKERKKKIIAINKNHNSREKQKTTELPIHLNVTKNVSFFCLYEDQFAS